MLWAGTHIMAGLGSVALRGSHACDGGRPTSPSQRSQVRLAGPLTCAPWIGVVVPEPFVPGDKVPALKLRVLLFLAA
jgi:hypothetical protein